MNRNLASFLILPVQRLPRYILLLKEISKKFTGDDKLLFDTAIEKTDASTQRINSSLKDADLRNRLWVIQEV
jgi:hypothetical protein